MEEHSDQEITERLFPDQARYGEEERRRFAILEGHWDVPLDSVPSRGGEPSSTDAAART
jgi:hypothetical protein